ncbi:hypothetical protein NMG60_11026088 [Bertholletia excelsa]
MEPYVETRIVAYVNKSEDPQANRDDAVAMAIRELQKTREELRIAQDDLMQSWLDSRPVIDELESQKSSLAAMKNRIAISTMTISDLESQLEATGIAVNSKKEEEIKARKTINKLNLELDQTREEMEQIKVEKDENRRVRSELKQVLRRRRQRLRALQLQIRALRLESEAFGASAAEALRYIKNSKIDDGTIEISREELRVLERRAKEENALSDWRVSVAMEQRLAAEASRDSALRRLKEVKELQTENKSTKIRRRKRKEKMAGNSARENAGDEAEVDHGKNIEVDLPQVEVKVTSEARKVKPPQQVKRARSDGKKSIKKKKASLFVRIRIFLVQKFRRLFR